MHPNNIALLKPAVLPYNNRKNSFTGPLNYYKKMLTG